ncbi:hypothetical protein HII31_06953 [Pseudocercospora fuligena]|uniref:Rhodopsin domain-containing protein n=1 Tax=Pseudocercospora fuligena TaxID=685502 RepID=A0A8H6RJZ8_9PEZI|nr:hypothetical protein HII31_06953 [Pseudocercospora fuligena]
MAVKASIAIMLLRLVVKPAHRYIVWASIVVTEVYSLAFFLLFIFQCSPSSYFWTRFGNGKDTCITTSAVVGAVYAYSVIVMVTDFTFAILPCVVVWNLENIPKREKVMVGFILAMGAIASIATIARLPYVHTLSNAADFFCSTNRGYHRNVEAEAIYQISL